MKCSNCGKKWVQKHNEFIASICPHCYMLMPILFPNNIIKEIMNEYGDDILLYSKLLLLVSDKIKNESLILFKRIRLVINEDIPRKLYKLKFDNENECTIEIWEIINDLRINIGMEIDAAYEIVNYFADALGYNTVTESKISLLLEGTPELKAELAVSPADLPEQRLPLQQSLFMDISFSSIKIGDIIMFADYKWLVLEMKNDAALILTKDIIEIDPYNTIIKDVKWESSYIREYLNYDFYDEFTEKQKDRIIETRIVNHDNLWFLEKGGEDTIDKIFLLSLDEVDNYFGNSDDYQNMRKKKYNDDCKYVESDAGGYFSNIYNYNRIARFNDKPIGWWLRSPGMDCMDAALVGVDGAVKVYGNYIHIGGGVRPALWLRL